jgi:putative spermidine/putrescine transport system permease protein
VSEAQPGGVLQWRLFLWPPLLIASLLLIVPQASFVWMSLHNNLGMGLISATLTVDNYRRVLTDPFYLGSLWMTFRMSFVATVITLLAAFPTAYALARTRSRWVSLLIALLLIASFMTVVIKALGLSLVLGQEGIVNHFLQGIGIAGQPLRLLNNDTGVVIGLVQYTLPLLVMLLFSVIQTIPPSLEEAAELHGATRLSTLRRIVLPLAMPGLIAGGLIVFNLDMGAFTSAVLLGGGKVLTLPVLIQRKIFLDVDYPLAAALATVLVAIVFAVNLLSVLLLRRARTAGGALR